MFIIARKKLISAAAILGAALAFWAGGQPAHADTPPTFTVLGDSNTTGHTGLLATGLANDASWVAHTTGHVSYNGTGWAVDGSTTTDMAAHAGQLTGNILAFMGSTNDVKDHFTWSTTEANVKAIAAAAHVDGILILAIAPQAGREAATHHWNDQLKLMAAHHGWAWADPWASMRNKNGNWQAQYTVDGRHGTPEAYEIVGRAVSSALAAMIAKPVTSKSGAHTQPISRR